MKEQLTNKIVYLTHYFKDGQGVVYINILVEYSRDIISIILI